MATFKVIANPHFDNYSTLLRDRSRHYEVREDGVEYNKNADELLDKVKALLGEPLCPSFPDGVYFRRNSFIGWRMVRRH